LPPIKSSAARTTAASPSTAHSRAAARGGQAAEFTLGDHLPVIGDRIICLKNKRDRGC
jgi:hypothetical protein